MSGSSHSNPWLLVIDLNSPAATGLILGLTAGLSPGPLLSLMLSETMRHGVRAGLLVAVAPICTDLPIIAVAVALHWLLPDSHVVQIVLGLGGGGYLLGLGAHGLLTTPPPMAQHAHQTSTLPSLGKAIVANLLNPNPYLFWMTIGVPAMVGLHRSAAALFIGLFYTLLIGSKAAVAVLASRSISFLGARSYVVTLKFLSLTLCGYGLNFLLDAFRIWKQLVIPSL